MSEQDQAMLEQYVAQAQNEFDTITQRIQELAAQNEEIVEANKEIFTKSRPYVTTGTVSFATAVIWGTVTAQLKYISPSANVVFRGSHWGVGFGGGISAGGAILTVPPRELLGDGSYSLVNASPALTMQFWRGWKYLGTFTGASLAVGSMGAGGSGKWEEG